MDEEEIETISENEASLDFAEKYGFPQQEDKEDKFKFLKKIFIAKNTTKGGFLNENELEAARINLVGAEYCKHMGLDLVKDHLIEMKEIITSSSLSRQGFLVSSAITDKREMASRLTTKKGDKK